MNLNYKIKAKSQEEAIAKLIKEYDVVEAEIKNVIEVSKPTSFFGFFNKDGEYKIEVEDDDNSEIENTLTSEGNAEVDLKLKSEETKEEVKKLVLKKAEEVLEKMGLNLEIEILEVREHYILINLKGNDNGIIIGKKGKTLNSFEYLLNSLCRNVKVEVDVEGFKAKRAETLRDLARKMAEKALTKDKVVKLNPMPSRERKIIHEIVNKYKELDTFSEGREPKRYIVIKRKKMG